MDAAKCKLNNENDLKACAINGTECSSYCFPDSEKTIIQEFDLVCDDHWVKQFVISIQMLGMLIGSFISGHFGETIGRKPTFYESYNNLARRMYQFSQCLSLWQTGKISNITKKKNYIERHGFDDFIGARCKIISTCIMYIYSL